MIRAALILASLAGPASASPLHPPERFDHPYTGALTVHRIDRANVWAECSDNGARTMRLDVAGCAFIEGGACTVYLATRTRRAPLAAILRHELAHCNGWPASHPH